MLFLFLFVISFQFSTKLSIYQFINLFHVSVSYPVLISLWYNHLLWHDRYIWAKGASADHFFLSFCDQGDLQPLGKWPWKAIVNELGDRLPSVSFSCVQTRCQACHFYPHLILSLCLVAMLGYDMAQFNFWTTGLCFQNVNFKPE